MGYVCRGGTAEQDYSRICLVDVQKHRHEILRDTVKC